MPDGRPSHGESVLSRVERECTLVQYSANEEELDLPPFQNVPICPNQWSRLNATALRVPRTNGLRLHGVSALIRVPASRSTVECTACPPMGSGPLPGCALPVDRPSPETAPHLVAPTTGYPLHGKLVRRPVATALRLVPSTVDSRGKWLSMFPCPSRQSPVRSVLPWMSQIRLDAAPSPRALPNSTGNLAHGRLAPPLVARESGDDESNAWSRPLVIEWTRRSVWPS